MKRGTSALRQTPKCGATGAVNCAGKEVTTSSEWLVARSEFTTNPNGRSGPRLIEQHGGRSLLSAGTRVSLVGQHVIEPMACICCMVMKHRITWSACTRATLASAHKTMVTANRVVISLRNVVLPGIFEVLLSGLDQWSVCDARHRCRL